MADQQAPPGFGDPASMRDLASAVGGARNELEELTRLVNKDVRNTIPDMWGGDGASWFNRQVDWLFKFIPNGVGSPAEAYEKSLNSAAHTMESARRALTGAHDYAARNNLVIRPDLNVAANPPIRPETQAQLVVLQGKVQIAETLADTAKEQIRMANRALEAAAVKTFQDAHDILGAFGGRRGGRPSLPPDKRGPGMVFRQDRDFRARANSRGLLKSHLDTDGNLVPANPAGTTTVRQHILGGLRPGLKSDSPYTSFLGSGSGKWYGDYEIRVDRTRLQADIDAGKLRSVEILPPARVQAELQDSINSIAGRPVDVRLTPGALPDQVKAFAEGLGLSRGKTTDIRHEIQAMLNTQRDGEWLIKGVIPKEYITGPYRNPVPKPPGAW